MAASYAWSSVLHPDFFGDFHDHLELSPLLVLGQNVAFLGGSEAALWRQTKLVEIDELGGLIDEALELVLGFKPPAFRGDEPEHHGLALGDEAQRLESAGAVAVVFQEITVHIDRV